MKKIFFKNKYYPQRYAKAYFENGDLYLSMYELNNFMHILLSVKQKGVTEQLRVLEETTKQYLYIECDEEPKGCLFDPSLYDLNSTK